MSDWLTLVVQLANHGEPINAKGRYSKEKREKSKKLPVGFNSWFFDCKFGQTKEDAKVINFADVIKSVDLAQSENYPSFYLEIVAKAIFREKKLSNDANDDEILED